MGRLRRVWLGGGSFFCYCIAVAILFEFCHRLQTVLFGILQRQSENASFVMTMITIIIIIIIIIIVILTLGSKSRERKH